MTRNTIANVQCIGALLLLLLLAACLPQRQILPKEQRDALGRLAIVSAHYAPTLNMDVTRGRGHGAAKGAAIGAAASIAGGAQSGDPYGLLFGILLAPVAATGGAVYGVIAADSSREVKSQTGHVEEYVLSTEFQHLLKREVLEYLMRTTSYPVEEAAVRGPTSVSEHKDYRELTGIDTVLEVGIREIRFQDLGVSNTKVNLQVSAVTRLIRVKDGRELFAQEYAYTSVGHDLAQWGSAQGEMVERELTAGFRQIAENIVDDFLLTCPLPAKAKGALAAVSPLPEFCFFCKDHLEPLPDLQPKLCWQPFAPSEAEAETGAWPGRVEQVVYDLRVGNIKDRTSYLRTGLQASCHRIEEPLAPCRLHIWSVRARFLAGETWQATPWVGGYYDHRFKTLCQE